MKADFIIVKNIIFFDLHHLHQITVIHGLLKKSVAEFLTDPEDKAPVRQFHAVNDRHMGNVGWNYDDISVRERKCFLTDPYADIALQKKVKFLIVMGMKGHLGFCRVVIIV